MKAIRFAAAALLVVLGAIPVRAEEPASKQVDAFQPAGQSQILRLWPGATPATSPADEGDKLSIRANGTVLVISNIRQPSLGVFLPNGKGPFPAVVICPGGGYRQESVTSEGHEVAQKFAANGVAAFVLKYRLPDGRPPAPGKLPLPQQDVFRAIRLVRAHAAEWNVDVKRVGVMGFSAGGHLAATAATLFDQASDDGQHDAISQQSARPDFGVLVYPVISMTKPTAHGGSHDRLIGKDADPATEARLDPCQNVTPQTPPLFIVHAADDRTVAPVNSMQMMAAAQKANVPCALLYLSHGGHGFGLGNDPEARGWSDQCLAWLRGQKLLLSAD